jgi:restriction endonuclease S subunit
VGSGGPKDTEVCEGAYVAMLGYGTTSPSTIGSLWRSIKLSVRNDTLDIDQELRRKDENKKKIEDAVSFVDNYVRNHCELSTVGDYFILPFFSRSDFYREYEVGCFDTYVITYRTYILYITKHICKLDIHNGFMLSYRPTDRSMIALIKKKL